MDQNSLRIIVPLIPLLPLAGFAAIGFLGKRLGPRTIGAIATSLVFGSFVFGVLTFIALYEVRDEMPLRLLYGNWITGFGFEIPFGFHIDQLSLLMTLVVSGVGAMIHLYSTGYMNGDKDYSRYFSYLNLFMFFMLTLVLAENYIMMFVGWEGVGLCSYLLIGFWYENSAPTQAGKKAFIVNRIGDAGFLIGLFLLVTSPLALEPDSLARTVSFQPLFENILHLIENDSEYFATTLVPLLTVITLLLFFGATGKSAQIPLYVWLPDAMEGPTPVSALIHAATMVTAGVYMVARSNLLFVLCPTTMATIAIIGAVTAIFAATIAMVQTDIKRVLAYSTISQLGYMFLGCGVGAFFAAIFHLMTHAFFKACLFLGAGSVIIGTHHEQDLRRLGGLKKWMPATRWTFLVATMAIAGMPMFSAFFSKDTILHEAFILPFAGLSAGKIACVIGYMTAFLTAVYMFRLYFRTFEGEYLGPEHVTPHETLPSMTGVLWVLAVLSIIGGLVGIPIEGFNGIQSFLEPVFSHGLEAAEKLRDLHHVVTPPWFFMALSLIIFVIGFLVARAAFNMNPDLRRDLKVRYHKLYILLWEKYRVDEFYAAVFVKPGVWLCGVLWKNFDEGVIDDNLVEGTGRGTYSLGELLKPFQSGYLRSYALYIVIGIVLLIWFAST